MELESILKALLIDGQLSCSCPYGNLEISASGDSRHLQVHFSNSRVFRYFLQSLPGFSWRSAGRFRRLIQKSSFSLVCTMDKALLLKKSPKDEAVQVSYGLIARQWLLWKLSL